MVLKMHWYSCNVCTKSEKEKVNVRVTRSPHLMTIADIVPATARMRAMGHHQSQIQRRTFVRHRVMPMHAHVHVDDDSPVKHSHLSIDVGWGSSLPPVVVATTPLPRADSVGYVPRARAVLQACTIVNQIREVLNQKHTEQLTISSSLHQNQQRT